MKKLKFHFQIKLGVSFDAWKKLVTATFMSVLDYGDVIYVNASIESLRALDTVYYRAQHFITSMRSRTHHCVLYASLGWLSLVFCRLNHWYILIFQCILDVFPPLHELIKLQTSSSNLFFLSRFWTQTWINLCGLMEFMHEQFSLY